MTTWRNATTAKTLFNVTTTSVSSPPVPNAASRMTARITGLWYFGLAVTGALGFLVVRPAILVNGDPAATLANLTDRAALAHAGVALEMGIVATQALAAVWFYALLRRLAPVAGFAVAVFGLMNAAAIMASGMFLATALAVAQDPSLASGGDQAGTVGLLYQLSTDAWGMGNLFFGLWLIPMGWVAIRTARFPRVLGWFLVAGGVGYVLSGFVGYGVESPPAAVLNALTFPSVVGEFWMIGYLLVRGIRPASAAAVADDAATRS